MTRRTAAVLTLLALAAPLAGCSTCETNPRFWKAVDRSTGATACTVDTVECPLGTRLDAVYLDSEGHEVHLAAPELTPITESEWDDATSGAGYEHGYCPRLRACWALPVAE